jgi:hypothetical protein
MYTATATDDWRVTQIVRILIQYPSGKTIRTVTALDAG